MTSTPNERAIALAVQELNALLEPLVRMVAQAAMHTDGMSAESEAIVRATSERIAVRFATAAACGVLSTTHIADRLPELEAHSLELGERVVAYSMMRLPAVIESVREQHRN